MDAPPKRTPLYETHRRAGARMMPFAGYDMPVQYTGILDEHKAVRERAGLFDVSHMGEVRVTGPHALDFVQHLVSNDAAKLTDGRAMYAVMCHPEGGIVDDLLVYRIAADDYLLVINASNVDKDWAHMNAHNHVGAALENLSDRIALLALQGPEAMAIAERATGLTFSDLPYYHFRMLAPGALMGSGFAIASHTGYTGESGLELYVDADRAEALWDALVAAGAEAELRPAGLGARDTLRLEAGYSLYGNDLTDDDDALSKPGSAG